METITEHEALMLVAAQRGRIFACEFIKRSTGESRYIVARQGVTKHLAHGKQPYRFSDHNLIPVFDMQKRDYRAIPIESLRVLVVNGERYVVTHGGSA